VNVLGAMGIERGRMSPQWSGNARGLDLLWSWYRGQPWEMEVKAELKGSSSIPPFLLFTIQGFVAALPVCPVTPSILFFFSPFSLTLPCPPLSHTFSGEAESVLVTVRESDAASPWDVISRNTLHEQKLKDWKHSSKEERAFDKLASVLQSVREREKGGESVLANMHSEHVSKHHVTYPAGDIKHRNFLQEFPETENVHTETTSVCVRGQMHSEQARSATSRCRPAE